MNRPPPLSLSHQYLQNDDGPSIDTIFGQALYACACTECIDTIPARDAVAICPTVVNSGSGAGEEGEAADEPVPIVATMTLPASLSDNDAVSKSCVVAAEI